MTLVKIIKKNILYDMIYKTNVTQ